MSLRKRRAKKQLTDEELESMRQLELMKQKASSMGISVDQVQNYIQAEETAFSLSDDTKKVSDNFEKISDMSASEGIVIRHPNPENLPKYNKRNIGYLDDIGNLRGMDGQFHPRTEKWLRDKGHL
jgi:hypothetical protein